MDAIFTFNDGHKDRTVDAFDLAIDEQIMLADGGELALLSKKGDCQATKDFIAKLRGLFKLEPWSKADDGTVTGTHSADVGRIYSEWKEFVDREKKEPESTAISSSATEADTENLDLQIAPAALDSGSTKTEQTIVEQSQ